MPSYALEPLLAKTSGDLSAGDPANRSRDKILLGTIAETGPRRKLWLDITGEQVVAILGKRGTGKSYTLGVLVEGLAAGGAPTPIASHTTARSGLVLDIMDIFWTSTISLSPNGSPEVQRQHALLQKAGIAPQPLNIDVWVPGGYEKPAVDPPNFHRFYIGARDLEIDDWGALFDINMLTEPRGMLLTDLVNRVSVQGYLDATGRLVSPKVNFDFDDLLTCLEQDRSLAQNYNDNTIRSIRQRLETYRGLPLFQGAPTSLSSLLQKGRVSVLMLGRVPDQLKEVIASVILRRLLRERRDASFAQKRLDLQPALSDADRATLIQTISESVSRTWVLLDEAHVLAGADQGSVARDALIKYAKEGRNYGLSLALATQQPSAVDARLMSQVETMIVHQLTSPKDALVALDNMRSPLPTDIHIDGTKASLDVLLRQLTPGTVTFSCGNAPTLPRVCVAAIRPRVSAHGGYEA